MAKWVERIPVDSFTSSATYIVGISDKGEYGCSCPMWKFRRQECKHIEQVKNERQASVIAAKRQGASAAQEAVKKARAKVLAQRAAMPKVAPVRAAAPMTSDPLMVPRRLIQLEDD